MMLSKAVLEEWRREALKGKDTDFITMYEGTASALASAYVDCQEHILHMTQELLDQLLLQRK